MKCYIVLYNHRFGIDTWPVYSQEAPSTEDVINKLKEEGEWDEWEDGDEASWVEVRGPFPLPERK